MASGMTVVNMARPTTRNKIWNNLKIIILFPNDVLCSPSDECGGVDVPIAHSGHGDNHAVHALEVGQHLAVVKQWRISVVLNGVDEPCSSPPHREEHHDDLQQPGDCRNIFWMFRENE